MAAVRRDRSHTRTRAGGFSCGHAASVRPVSHKRHFMPLDQPPENVNGQSAAEQSGAAPKVVRGCTIIPGALSDMVRDAGLNDADLRTLVALLDLCRYGTRQSHARKAEIAKACGSSKSAVGRSLSRLAKSGLIERRPAPHDGTWGTRLLFDPRSLVAKEGQRDWTLAVAEELAADEADETKSHRLDVLEGEESSRVAATTIVERCEELGIGSYWFSDTDTRTIFLYRGCDGRFFERAIDIDGTTLEIRDDRCYLVTDEQAAERYKRHPEKAPAYLRPVVAKFDLTAAKLPELVVDAAPSGNGTAATNGHGPERNGSASTEAAANGHDIEAPAGLPSAPTPKAPKSNLSVDDLAVAAWTRLSREKGRPPSITQVAREIGHTRQHLYRCPNFMSLVATEKVQRDKRKQRLPRGWKDPSGRVEAYQDED